MCGKSIKYVMIELSFFCSVLVRSKSTCPCLEALKLKQKSATVVYTLIEQLADGNICTSSTFLLSGQRAPSLCFHFALVL